MNKAFIDQGKSMKNQNDHSKTYKRNSSLSCTSNMKNLLRATTILIAGICLFSDSGSFAYTQHSLISNTVQKEKVMKTQASGTFDVQLKPQDDKSADAIVGRLLIDKQFHGDLEGISKGQMLTAITAVKDSAGYVAIEQVSGTLQGRKGTFMLQHTGLMTRGEPQLTITVVPDSGTDELTGISGKMTIKIADGKHSYDFEYTLTKTP
jgi:hypothetical protein